MSPIHDQTYRRYAGARRQPGQAWLVIAATGLRSLVARKWFLAVAALAWIMFIARTAQIYAVTAYPVAGQALPVNARMFQQFVEQQSLFAFFVTIFAGAGLIAADRRVNALQIYLSKPLWRLEYIGGKCAILAVALLLVTLLPALLLVGMQVVLSGSFDFLRTNLHILPAIVVACLMRILLDTATMLALSSLSTSTRYVAVLYTGVIFFTNALYAILRVITGGTRVAWVSIGANLENVTDALFRQPPRYDTPVAVSVLVLLGLIVVSASVLERRVRGVEVVS